MSRLFRLLLASLLIVSLSSPLPVAADTKKSTYLSELKRALEYAVAKSFPYSQGFWNGYNFHLKEDEVINRQIKQIQTLCKLYKYSAENNISLNKAARDGARAAFDNEKVIIKSIKAQGANRSTILDYESVTMDTFFAGTFVYCNKYFSITTRVFASQYQSLLKDYLSSDSGKLSSKNSYRTYDAFNSCFDHKYEFPDARIESSADMIEIDMKRMAYDSCSNLLPSPSDHKNMKRSNATYAACLRARVRPVHDSTLRKVKEADARSECSDLRP